MAYIDYYHSPLGKIVLASDTTSLTGLWFENQKYFGSTLTEPTEQKQLPIFEQTKQWLTIYFSGKAPDFRPALSLKGTDFRKAVWEIMLTIPFGQTMTYKAIAEKYAKRNGLSQMSAHAIGNAVSHNPISLIIPCHRIVGTNGSLTGYAGGLDKKVQLLTLEKIDLSTFFVPTKKTVL